MFHGGSGSEKAKITEAVGYGVFKMNIDTDLQFAYSEAIGKFVSENPKAFMYQIDPETDKPTRSSTTAQVSAPGGAEHGGAFERGVRRSWFQGQVAGGLRTAAC